MKNNIFKEIVGQITSLFKHRGYNIQKLKVFKINKEKIKVTFCHCVPFYIILEDYSDCDIIEQSRAWKNYKTKMINDFRVQFVPCKRCDKNSTQIQLVMATNDKHDNLFLGNSYPKMYGQHNNKYIISTNIKNLVYISKPIVSIINNPPESGLIKLQAYCISKDTSGHDILFINGIFSSHLMWKNQLLDDKLRLHNNLYAVELRGSGESSKNSPTGNIGLFPNKLDTIYKPHTVWAEDIHQTIIQLGLYKPIIIVHSTSTFAVQDYLKIHEDSNIGGLVIVDGFTEINTPSFFTRVLTSDMLEKVFIPNKLFSESLKDRIIIIKLLIDLMASQNLNQATRDELLMTNMLVRPEILAAIFSHDGFAPYDPSDSLPIDHDDIWRSIGKSTLIIHGKLDRITKVENAVYTSNLIEGSILKIYDDVGHIPPIETPKKFNSDLKNFFDSI
jgi:pimeloyl-ACP methyl ester carboxylesterase